MNSDKFGLKAYIEEKPILKTSRLMLRTMRVEDVPDLDWMGDPSLYRYWGKRPGKCDLQPARLFEKAKKPTKSFHWGIVHKQDQRVIGECWVYLIENDRMAKIAYRLASAYQGHGFMAEALIEIVDFCFSHTELQRLWSDVHIENTASIKTLEKVGFIREGHIHQGKLVNQYCDYYLYGLRKPDWLDVTQSDEL